MSSPKSTRATKAASIQSVSRLMLNEKTIAPAVCVAPPAPVTSPSTPMSFEMLHAFSDEASQGIAGKTGVLVFCSSRRPGGGWLNGAKAQEEDISLASTWATQAAASDHTFYKDSDGLGNDLALMADGFWLCDPTGSPLLEPKPVVFGGVAAPNRNAERVTQIRSSEQIDILASRLLAAFEGWRQHKVETVVVGAIGCGVFKWDPQDSALALTTALQQTAWRGHLICAIPDDQVLAIFQKQLASQFETPSKKPIGKCW